MIEVLARSRWSVTFGGPADPVWLLRMRRTMRAMPLPVGSPAPSLPALVENIEQNPPDPILDNLLIECREFAGSLDYLLLTETP